MRQYLFFLLLLLRLPAAAQPVPPTGNLTIFSEEGDKFYLIMNGQRINSNPQTNVRVELLPQPYYTVKLIFTDSLLPNISKPHLAIADVDGVLKDVTYRIRADRKKGRKLVFASAVPAPQNFVPTGPDMFVRRWGQPEPPPGVMAAPIPAEIPPPPGYDTSATPPAPPKPDNGCRYAMKPADFNAALRTLSKVSFEETRLSTARSIISSNCVTTAQVIELCSYFTFESNKLDFAKIAYGRVIDPGNYFKLADIFRFDSNKRELSRFISGY